MYILYRYIAIYVYISYIWAYYNQHDIILKDALLDVWLE